MMKYSTGFTLVEMLVVIGVLATVGMIFSSSFLALMGGSKKADIVSEVKQNGDFAISTIESMIRRSKPFPQCIGGTSVQITNPDGKVTTFTCDFDDGSGKKKVASNSAVQNAPLTNDQVTVVSGTCLVVCPTPMQGSPAGVSVTFTLEQYIPNVTPRASEQSRQTFSTTVFQRTY